MAYFEKNDDGNYEYSYCGVADCIFGEYVNPEGRISKKWGTASTCCPPWVFSSIILLCGLDPKSAILTSTPPWGGGVLQEEIFLKVRFQKRVGTTLSKSDFDFGSRTFRLCTPEGQK